MLSGEKGNQLNFFEIAQGMTKEEEEALGIIRDLKIEEMTPMEVMNVVYQLREKI